MHNATLNMFDGTLRVVISDEQIKARRDSKRYHLASKGCELEEERYQQDKRSTMGLLGMRCKQHPRAEICSCGWEYMWHYGEDMGKIVKQDKKGRGYSGEVV